MTWDVKSVVKHKTTALPEIQEQLSASYLTKLNLQQVMYRTVVANKTGPTRVAHFRAVFTAERLYLFHGPETTYAVEQ